MKATRAARRQPVTGRAATPAEASAVIEAVNRWEPVRLTTPETIAALTARGLARPIGGQDA